MDINRSHASSTPAGSPTSTEEPRSPASAAQPDVSAVTQERDGTLASLAGRRRSRSPDAGGAGTPEQAGPSSGGERPRKKLRTARGVRFAEPAGDGSSRAARSSPSQPMQRLHAMPRHEADDPEQRSVNRQIAQNQRALADRLHVERQPMAALMRHDWFLAETGRLLHPSDQLSFWNDVLHLPEEARAEFARLLPAGSAGAYLSRDEEALAHSLDDGTPDVVVRRSSWLMRAGLTGRHFPGAALSESMLRTIEQAESELRAHFEHGGPNSQAEAVLNLVASVLFTRTLEDTHRLAQLVLQPRYVRALPDSQRATTLWLLANSLQSANYFAWSDLSSDAAGMGAGDAQAPAAGAGAARINAFAAIHRRNLAETIPMLLEAARGIAPMPSNAAQGMLFAVAQMAARGMPDVPAQRALLDLYGLLLPHVHGPARAQAYTDLASMLSTLGEPGLQRRAFNLLTQHRPGVPRTDDRLAHLDPVASTRVLLSVVYQLNVLPQEMRDDALALLTDQTAPGVIARFSGDDRRRLLEQARELDVPPGDNLTLLAIVGRLLDHAPVDEVVQSLQVLLGHADTAVEDDALDDAVWAMWDRFLPQLPADRSGNLLAHAVAVDTAYLPVAMRRFAGAEPNRLYAMLAGLNDNRSQPLANELVELGIDDPDALHASLRGILDEQPPAQRAAAAASIVQVLAWAAGVQPDAERPRAIGNTLREATRIVNDAPVQARAEILAAYLRPEPSGRAGVLAFRYLAAAMSTGGEPFHRWLSTIPRGLRLSMATGVARLLSTIRNPDAAARAVTIVEALYPRSLDSWSDHHGLVGALTDTVARWPATFGVERMRIGAMIEHGLRALPPGAEHERALRQLAAIARHLPQGASSSGEVPPGMHAWAMQLMEAELARTDVEARARVLSALGDDRGR
ncbi:MAG: hypothetical protein ACTHNZ_05270 [Trinickia sp.]|uniref:hypothetical protein n=1 Tax=Trinickia sp. TaxID=2571163 RepID=UPI003F7D4C03